MQHLYLLDLCHLCQAVHWTTFLSLKFSTSVGTNNATCPGVNYTSIVDDYVEQDVVFLLSQAFVVVQPKCIISTKEEDQVSQ